MKRRNPTLLPPDFRMGIYTPHNGSGVIYTIDVVVSQREIIIHDETNDLPLTISPQMLRKQFKRIATKIGDGCDYKRLQGKRINELGDLGYGIC